MHISKRVPRRLCAGRVERVRRDCSRSAPRLLFAIRAASDDLLGWGVEGDEDRRDILKSKQQQQWVMD